jgi:hypothetical protein
MSEPIDLRAIEARLRVPEIGSTAWAYGYRMYSREDAYALLAALRETRALLGAVAQAYDVCDGPRGAFSCHDAHDLRCPKGRAASAAEWRGDWVCKCGREDLDAALGRVASVLASCVANDGAQGKR